MSRTCTTLIRRCILVLAFGIAMAHADGAMAYWQSGGTGIDELQTISTHTALRVTPTAELSAMAPGGTPQRLGGEFDNTGAAPIHVGTVVASIASVAKASGAAQGSCDRSDFQLEHRVMAVAADVPSGQGTGQWSGATISFRNKPGVDQNACMGASVNLHYRTT